jgi:NAD(P)-dependent dehydrogenase (short-subunit alcohol dehydrogenase family)
MPTALITGTGRGLGRELARQYAADGWRVIGTSREERAEHRLDVRDRKQVDALARKLKGEPIDLLFCNAGTYGPRGMSLGRLDYDGWEDVLRVNLLGPAALIEALVDNVAASERRVVAVMSRRLGSIAEASGSSFLYATSKAALNALAKGLSVTLASRDIIVVAVSPGWVRTDMGGENAPLTPEQSVRGLRKVISALRKEDSGKFLSHDGTEIPW